jgi:isoamylase
MIPAIAQRANDQAQSTSALPDMLQPGQSQPGLLQPGACAPFGATVVPKGVNFAIFSEHATRVELCLFDASGAYELKRIALYGPDHGVFHGLLPGAQAGLIYGYRVHGPYQPHLGQRFNPNKLLLDPYAREVHGRFHPEDTHYGYALGHPEGARSFDARDNALYALKARVSANLPPLADTRPKCADAHVLLYEVHVKGFSMQLPGLPTELRGHFAALAHPLAIAHFKALGVTTLSLLPVQFCLSETALLRAGKTNYWGYNTLAFFCPDPRLGSKGADPAALILEFRDTISALHAAGLEVVLDVVYNHSAEADEFGQTLSFRGIDNSSWYRLSAHDASHYENFSGCGNSLNIAHPRITQFVLDNMRYWVEVMGVDGFRFDLASALGRNHAGFDPGAAFFIALQQDPLLSQIRLISEPWDCGPQGYQLGRFPGRFVDWNDRFRDATRRYWLNLPLTRGEFARRFFGSSDVFHHGSRKPTASVNFITAHDGFTLQDLLSYSHKHNHENGEDNRDGRADEICKNFGTEGETADACINAVRTRVRYALLASLLLAQGTPMLLAGDEFGNSQRGNNNAYCQDNPVGWLDWRDDPAALRLISALTQLRRSNALLRHPDWFSSDPHALHEARVVWHTPAGGTMQLSDWHEPDQRALSCSMFAAGAVQATVQLLFNPTSTPLLFHLREFGWTLVLDSSGSVLPEFAGALALAEVVLVPAQSVQALQKKEIT